MARGIIRKPSFWKIVGAYRSQWKRMLRRWLIPGYGRRGVGWWRDPKKAWYNWWYYRTTISVYDLFGHKISRVSRFFVILCASIVSILAAPIDIARESVVAHKIKKARKAREQRKSEKFFRSNTNQTKKEPVTSCEASFAKSNTASSVSKDTSKNLTEHKQALPVTKLSPIPSFVPKEKMVYGEAYVESLSGKDWVKVEPRAKSEPPKEPDENMPKSKPKHETDQYIRKRMIIAGASYCKPEVLAKLEIGTYFELVAEPNNPYDKDAVKLTYEGEKIGYVPKADRLAFVTCLKLNRKIYGVITAIDDTTKPTKYEFEVWFDT